MDFQNVFAEILEAVKEGQINDKDNLEMAAYALLELKYNMKDFEAREKEAIGDLKKQLADAQKPFKAPKKDAKEAEEILREKILSFKKHLEDLQDRLMGLISSGEDVDNAQATLASLPAFELPQGISIRQDRAWRVADFEKVPIKYLTIDEKAIEADLKAGEKIDGVELYQKDVLVVRGSK